MPCEMLVYKNDIEKQVTLSIDKSELENNTVSQNILVFTHEGELVKNVKYANSAIGKIALSDDFKIYTFGEERFSYSDWRSWGLKE